MMLLNEGKKYGVKVTIIDSMDYDDFNEICECIKSKGFKLTMVDNGNVVCEKITVNDEGK